VRRFVSLNILLSHSRSQCIRVLDSNTKDHEQNTSIVKNCKCTLARRYRGKLYQEPVLSQLRRRKRNWLGHTRSCEKVMTAVQNEYYTGHHRRQCKGQIGKARLTIKIKDHRKSNKTVNILNSSVKQKKECFLNGLHIIIFVALLKQIGSYRWLLTYHIS